ncbi:MAG: hypothetical protein QXW37_04700 [Candidatus Nitrosotenuis sp.]
MQVIKVTGRGTGIRKAEVSAQNWAGDSYRKVQQERLAKIARNLTLVMGRGEKTLNIKDLPAPRPRPHVKSLTCVTNRGTSARKCSY